MKYPKNYGDKQIIDISIRRLLSYNPQYIENNNLNFILKYNIKIICEIKSINIEKLKDNLNSSEFWIEQGKLYIILMDLPNLYSSYAHVIRITNQIRDEYFWFLTRVVNQHFQFYAQSLKLY